MYAKSLFSNAGLAVCAAAALTILSTGTASAQFQGARRGTPGAVYTMSNAATGNEILAFSRAADGTLTDTGTYDTGGLGAGGGLGNQAGVVLSANHHRLFAVNAGSNDISAFTVTPGGLVLTDVEPSLGERPVSIAVYEDLLYVLNAGGAGSIQGFTVSDDGDIMPIADSMRPLSGAEMTGPAQIGFTPDGAALAVTEKATSLIDTYVVHMDGTTSGPNVFASSGQTPFGFDFTSRGGLLVSEAFGGAAGMSAASSYSIAPDGTLAVISSSVPSGETAACWLVVNPNSRHAYTTNTGSGTLSGYFIDDETDEITLMGNGVAFDIGAGTAPLDAAFSTNGRFLYTLNSGSHEIGVFRVNKSDGSLTSIETIPGLPETTNGLAAH